VAGPVGTRLGVDLGGQGLSVSAGFTMNVAVAVLLLATSMTAQAQEPKTLLACNGTTTEIYEAETGTLDNRKPEPYSVGIVIDFTARTVEGLGLTAKISGVTDVTIEFKGSEDMSVTISGINGVMPRTTNVWRGITSHCTVTWGYLKSTLKQHGELRC
jgi:hypothetical protein